MRLLEGPDFQAVDVEVLLGGKGLVVEGGAFGGGASVQLGVQPQTQLTPAGEDTKSWGTGVGINLICCQRADLLTLLRPTAENLCCPSRSKSSLLSSDTPANRRQTILILPFEEQRTPHMFLG